MSHIVSDKLPIDFFQDTIKEKAQMIWKYLHDMGESSHNFHAHGAKYGNIQMLFLSRGGFIKTPLHLFKFQGFARTIIFLWVQIELYVKRGVKLVYRQVSW